MRSLTLDALVVRRHNTKLNVRTTTMYRSNCSCRSFTLCLHYLCCLDVYLLITTQLRRIVINIHEKKNIFLCKKIKQMIPQNGIKEILFQLLCFFFIRRRHSMASDEINFFCVSALAALFADMRKKCWNDIRTIVQIINIIMCVKGNPNG